MRHLLPFATIASAALLSGGAIGCNSQFPNPFENVTLTTPPRADANLIFTANNYAAKGGSPHEIYAADAAGARIDRLTFCNRDARLCDSIEAAPSPDRRRFAVRRVIDTTGDGKLTAADGAALVIVDLAARTEGILVPADQAVSGVDWSTDGSVIAFSAKGPGGIDDLYRINPDGQESVNLTSTSRLRERHPRINPRLGQTMDQAVYEVIGEAGKAQIYAFVVTATGAPSGRILSTGGEGSDFLPGTPYVVGSDTDPAYSPRGDAVVFRRLTAVTGDGLGTWDVLTVKTDGTGLSLLVSGPRFRGAPDWGPQGIVFDEVDPARGTSSFVLVQPDGSGPRTLLSVSSVFDLTFPRWLP